MTSYASFDSLCIAHHLDPALGPASRGEFHLFGYLACILFLIGENAVSEWQYGFAATAFGTPFSTDLDGALVENCRIGFLKPEPPVFRLTERGEDELRRLREISSLTVRERFIEAACASSLAMPSGLIRNAISKEPQITTARTLDSKRALLDETAIDSLYEYFAALRRAVGDQQADLLVPALVWIRYFSAVGRTRGSAAADDD